MLIGGREDDSQRRARNDMAVAMMNCFTGAGVWLIANMDGVPVIFAPVDPVVDRLLDQLRDVMEDGISDEDQERLLLQAKARHPAGRMNRR
jgi:hypothetical protein